jgi:WD40 repeat protein
MAHEFMAEPPRDADKAAGDRFSAVPLWEYSADDAGIHHCGFSPTGRDVCVSQYDGNVQILSARTGRVSYTVPFITARTVVSVAKFHPRGDWEVILACGTSGHLGLCQYTSGKFLWRSQELGTNIFTADFCPDGGRFGTAGKDGIVRIYDTTTGRIVQSFSDESALHHSSRVHSLVFHREFANLVATGGWDMRVLLFDLRQRGNVKSFGGPNICGDSLDMSDYTLLAGSWRAERPLELWDIRATAVPMRAWAWGGDEVCQVYAAKFCQNGGWIVAGGSEAHSIKTFDPPAWDAGARLGYFENAVVSVGVSSDASVIVAATQDGKCCAFGKAGKI